MALLSAKLVNLSPSAVGNRQPRPKRLTVLGLERSPTVQVNSEIYCQQQLPPQPITASRRDVMLRLMVTSLAAVNILSAESVDARNVKPEIRRKIKEKLEMLREKAGITKSPSDDKSSSDKGIKTRFFFFLLFDGLKIFKREWAVRMDSEKSSSYYGILGVDKNSSVAEIRSAYRRLAMRWHPDRWTRNPAVLGEAKRKFQQIQEAYSVLSDRRKRTMYDAGLYNSDNDEEEEDEGFVDFLQEMVSLMADVEREEKIYSMEELQQMFVEMAEGYDSCAKSAWYGGPSSFFKVDEVEESCRESKRARLDSSKSRVQKDSYVHSSGLETIGSVSFAN